LGVALLDGDISKKEVLVRARVWDARAAYVFAGADLQNLEVAMQIYALYEAHGTGRPMVCHVHIARRAFIEHLETLSWVEKGGFKLRFFNTYQNIARALFRAHPIEGTLPDIAALRGQALHMVIVGFGDLGEAMLLQAAMLAQVPGSPKPKFTIVAMGSAAKKEDFLERQPNFHKVGDIEFVERLPIDRRSQFNASLTRENQRAIVVVTLENAAEGVAWGLHITTAHSGHRVPVFVHVAEERSLSSFLGKMRQDQKSLVPANSIFPFGSIETSTGGDMLLGYELDGVAMELNKRYLAHRRLPDADLSSFELWDKLAEEYKQSNRAWADHIGVKVRMIGCEIEESGKNSDTVDFEFTATELEILAEVEHSRWMAERYLTGWDFGSVTDRAQRQHSSLVPWDSLPEKEKEVDREVVKTIPEVLAKTGLRIRRKTGDS
jgi:hypothetical protein